MADGVGSPERQAEKAEAHAGPGAVEPADLGVNEKHLVRKLDLHLIPLVMLLYLFSFLDR